MSLLLSVGMLDVLFLHYHTLGGMKGRLLGLDGGWLYHILWNYQNGLFELRL